MIKVKGASVQVQGLKLVLMAELSTLVNSLLNQDVLTKEDIEYSVKIALLSEEELAEESDNVEKMREKKEDEKENAVDDFLVEALKILFS